MSLNETIAAFCGEDLAHLEYRLTVYGSGCIYAEGVKCIKSFSAIEVVLGLKNSCIKITGERLVIEKFCGGDAIVKGRVVAIERICN